MRKSRFKLIASAIVMMAFTCFAEADPVLDQGDWRVTLELRDLDHDGVADAIYDNSANLTWFRDISALPIRFGSFAAASGYAQAFTFGSASDWRVPTREELIGLNEARLGNSGSGTHGIPFNTGPFVGLTVDYDITWTATDGTGLGNYYVYYMPIDWVTSYTGDPAYVMLVTGGDVGASANNVPEPGSLALLGIALLCSVWTSRTSVRGHGRAAYQ